MVSALEATPPVYRVDPNENATHFVFHATRDIEVWEYRLPAHMGLVKRGEITPFETVMRQEDDIKTKSGKKSEPKSAKWAAEAFRELFAQRGVVILDDLRGMPYGEVKLIQDALLSHRPENWNEWLAYLNGEEVKANIETLPENLKKIAPHVLGRIIASVERGKSFETNILSPISEDYNNNSKTEGGAPRKQLMPAERDGFRRLGLEPPADFKGQIPKDDKKEQAELIGQAVAAGVAAAMPAVVTGILSQLNLNPAVVAPVAPAPAPPAEKKGKNNGV